VERERSKRGTGGGDCLPTQPSALQGLNVGSACSLSAGSARYARYTGGYSHYAPSGHLCGASCASTAEV